MIYGYHAIFGAYGFWLPNDPRGSWSEFVGAWELRRYGRATKTTERRSVAAAPHDTIVRCAAKRALNRPAVLFTGLQARAVGRGFGQYVAAAGLRIWACAILPDHVHLVFAPSRAVKHHLDPRRIIVQLKGDATERLKRESLHPFGDRLDRQGRTPKCFARGEWIAYLNADDVPHAIHYVEKNPEKEGKPPQRWSFVEPYRM